MRRFVFLLALCGGLLASVCTTAPSTVSAREPGQEIIRCGQQTPHKGPPAFSPGPCASIPCTPPTTPCAPAAAASLLNPAPAPTGISILWDRCSSSPPGSA